MCLAPLIPSSNPNGIRFGQHLQGTQSETEFMKWNELGSKDRFGNSVVRHDLPQDDFTLENRFAPSDASRYTDVLLQTPWLFRMTPPWQLTLRIRCGQMGTLSVVMLTSFATKWLVENILPQLLQTTAYGDYVIL